MLFVCLLSCSAPTLRLSDLVITGIQLTDTSSGNTVPQLFTFQPDVLFYNISVPFNNTMITFVPTLEYNSSMLMINGVIQSAGTVHNQNLTIGENVLEITVINVVDGVLYNQTYTLIINREACKWFFFFSFVHSFTRSFVILFWFGLINPSSSPPPFPLIFHEFMDCSLRCPSARRKYWRSVCPIF